MDRRKRRSLSLEINKRYEDKTLANDIIIKETGPDYHVVKHADSKIIFR